MAKYPRCKHCGNEEDRTWIYQCQKGHVFCEECGGGCGLGEDGPKCFCGSESTILGLIENDGGDDGDGARDDDPAVTRPASPTIQLSPEEYAQFREFLAERQQQKAEQAEKERIERARVEALNRAAEEDYRQKIALAKSVLAMSEEQINARMSAYASKRAYHRSITAEEQLEHDLICHAGGWKKHSLGKLRELEEYCRRQNMRRDDPNLLIITARIEQLSGQ